MRGNAGPGPDDAPSVGETFAESTPVETVDVQLAATVDAAALLRDGVLHRGTMLGRYLVLGTLGSGGMGVVYSAHDPDLDRKVALKLLKADSGDEGRRAALVREAQAMAKLAHPNVVSVHDVGVVDGRVFVAMEFVQGSTLREWLAAAPRRWQEILAVFLAAGRGLIAAHEAGLVHRDLKPDNIMVGDDGRVRVMDFGLARADPSAPAPLGGPAGGEHTQLGAFAGTPAYMSPEQWERRRDVSAQADQFAFCVSLWEALYGHRPFESASEAALMFAVLEDRRVAPREPARAPAWLRAIVERGLSRRPEERWPSMASLVAELARDRQARRRRWIAGLAGLALLVALAAGLQEIQERRANEERAVEKAAKADQDAHEAARQALLARDAATARLWGSLRSQAEAYQRSVDAGRRFSSLAAIAEAAAISRERGMTSEERRSLRNLAIAGLVYPDARVVLEWPHEMHDSKDFAVDPALEHYVGCDRAGRVLVRSLPDHATILEIPAPSPDVWHTFLDLGAKDLVVHYVTRSPLATPTRFFDLEGDGAARWVTDESVTFDASAEEAVLWRGDGSLEIIDTARGQTRRHLRTRASVGQRSAFSLDPTGRFLALCDNAERRCEIIDVIADAPVMAMEGLAYAIPGWSKSGVVAIPVDNDVSVWDVTTRELRATLRGHVSGVIELAFHPNQQYVASGSWDGTTRIWDWSNGAEVVRIPGSLVRFSADGRRLVTRGGPNAMMLDFDPGDEVHTFPGPAETVDFSQDGRLLAIAGDGGAAVWAIDEHRLLWREPSEHCFSAYFDARTPGLYTDCHQVGLSRRALSWSPDGDLRVSTPTAIRPAIPDEYPVVSRPRPGSPWLAINAADAREVDVIDATGHAVVLRLDGPRPLRDLALSPDGRWLAAGGYGGRTVSIWDLSAPERRLELPGDPEDHTDFAFTADGGALLIDNGGSYTVWDLSAWRPRISVANDHGTRGFPVAVSPDGRLYAVMHDGESFHLLDAADLRPLAVIPTPRLVLRQLLFSPDGRWLAAAADKGGVRLWDIALIRRRLAELDLDW